MWEGLPDNSFFQSGELKNLTFPGILCVGGFVFIGIGIKFFDKHKIIGGISMGLGTVCFIIMFILLVFSLIRPKYRDKIIKLNSMPNITYDDRKSHMNAWREFDAKINALYKDDDGWPWSPPIKTPV